MVKQPFSLPNKSYTFYDYFEMKAEVQDILAFFGYSFEVVEYHFPQKVHKLPYLTELQARLKRSLPFVILTTEAARREFLIAPVLQEILPETQAKVRTEYPIEVNNYLKGTLDYYLQGQHNILVIEAKQGDLLHGFTQLAVELVALDQWLEPSGDLLYGAVTMGEVWRFGLLDRQQKRVIQDLNLYAVPMNLAEIMQILIGILGSVATKE